jgi:hypothetical protein
MTLRAVLLSVLVAGALCVPAAASQPHELAARFITNPAVTGGTVDENGLPPVACVASFAWFEKFSPHQLDPADTVTLEMAIIPLRTHSTQVILHESARGVAFAELRFSDGLVKGVPYDRSGWNDVTVQLRPATQDYTITVNGATGGPFAYESSCQQQGGCFTLEAFVLLGHSDSEGSDAWIDSVSLSRDSAAGREMLREVNFDRPCGAVYLTTGGLLISRPPQRTRSRR